MGKSRLGLRRLIKQCSSGTSLQNRRQCPAAPALLGSQPPKPRGAGSREQRPEHSSCRNGAKGKVGAGEASLLGSSTVCSCCCPPAFCQAARARREPAYAPVSLTAYELSSLMYKYPLHRNGWSRGNRRCSGQNSSQGTRLCSPGARGKEQRKRRETWESNWSLMCCGSPSYGQEGHWWAKSIRSCENRSLLMALSS